MATGSIRAAFAFGRWAIVPRRVPPPRTACLDCMGGGSINGVACRGGCGGRGWFDAGHPPRSGKTADSDAY